MASANAEQQQQQHQQQPQHQVLALSASFPASGTAINQFDILMADFIATAPAVSSAASGGVSGAVPSATVRRSTPTYPTNNAPPLPTNMSMATGVPSSSMPAMATAGAASGSQAAVYPHPAHLHRVTPSQHHTTQGHGLAQGSGLAQGQGLGQSRQGSALDDIHATR